MIRRDVEGAISDVYPYLGSDAVKIVSKDRYAKEAEVLVTTIDLEDYNFVPLEKLLALHSSLGTADIEVLLTHDPYDRYEQQSHLQIRVKW